MELFKASKKTIIDNADFQYLGNKKQLLKMIEDRTEEFEDPHFVLMRNKETEELALFFFEGKLPELKLSVPNTLSQMQIYEEHRRSSIFKEKDRDLMRGVYHGSCYLGV